MVLVAEKMKIKLLPITLCVAMLTVLFCLSMASPLEDIKSNSKPQTMEKRDTGRYNFGLGKRPEYPSQEIPEPYFVDPEGEQDPGEYSILRQIIGDPEVEPEVEEEEILPLEKREEKRTRRYGFGLGKREINFEDYMKRRYNFGLGKRSPAYRYNFGLGKREIQRYGFGLGKREPQRYNFGLGKRQTARYNFGLGKRELNRYNFGLGKRNSDSGYGSTTASGQLETQ